MSPHSFNIFIVFSFIFHQSHGFQVTQPQVRTVNSDKLATISCEHTASTGFIKDIRLNSISSGKTTVLWQKGMKKHDKVAVYQEKENKYVFIIFNIGPQEMKQTYECEVTVQTNDIDKTVKGTPTQLKEALGPNETRAPPPCAPPSTPPPEQLSPVIWILTGVLALMVTYSCVVTFLCIARRNSNKDCENTTYVEMRKAPPPRNQYE